jgi:Xaa-Pro aminopeptidase
LLNQGSPDVIQAGTVVTLEIEMWKAEKGVVKVDNTIAVYSDGTEILTISPRRDWSMKMRHLLQQFKAIANQEW